MPAKPKSAKRSTARPIWRGRISFGLVQVPVALHSAESRNDLKFRLLDSRDHSRIRYERVNQVTGEEVPWNDVVKAFEYDDSNYVVLSDADFKRASVEATNAIDIEHFVDSTEISPMYFDTPYYLVPDKHGEKGYALLREGLLRTRRVGLSRVVIRTRQHVAVLRVEGPALTLDLLRFKQELRPVPADLPPLELKKNGITSREVEMAVGLIESMTAKWKPEQYKDEYRTALMKWIEKKARSGGVTPPEPAQEIEETPAQIINITDLLEKSLRRQGKAAGSAANSTASRRRSTPRLRRKAAG